MPLHRDDPKSVGGYKLVDRLGAGGMGIVYRGRARSGREVAVKVVHAQYAEDPVFRTRFRQEIEAVRKVSGAFTAPVVDADPEAVRPWMATQYVPGRSLADRLRERGPLRAAELRQLALGLVEALRDIHRAGVVHRDLKPANVLMAEDGPRVIDFGISRAAENHQTLTETGQMIGTPPFMSPEQLTDARKVGPASDVFSLGALLVYATTGRGPFDADSPYLTAYRVVHNEPVLDGIGQPFRGILERCLTKDAEGRPGLDELAREFAAALPEAAPGDLPTVTLRGDAPVVPQTRPGTLADPASTGGAGRRRRIRPLPAVTGTVGALTLGLTAYLLLGPGWAGSEATPSSASRWAALPSDWKPWQTTVFETSPLGLKQALGGEEGLLAGEPECVMHEDAVYCAGESVLPVRVDAETGKIVWRAEVAPADTVSGRYSASLLGAQRGTVLLWQSITTESAVDDPVHVLALDARTGDQLWRHKVENENLDLALSGDVVLTSDNGRTVTARSLRTGAERWTLKVPTDHYCSFMTVGAGLYAQFTPNDGQANTSQLLEVDRTDGSVRHRLKVPVTSGVVGGLDGRLVLLETNEEDAQLGEGLIYDRIALVDPKTGARTTRKLADEYGDTVTLADGTLWFTSSNGQVVAVAARTGKVLWRAHTSLEQPGEARYDARADVVYLASASGRVAALDGHKGTVLWETLPHSTSVTPGTYAPKVMFHDGALVVSIPNGTLFTLDPAHPERQPVSG
ncbi:serine/threonine-protein kinase [Streptomyces sp. DT2A-34]|uniref:serine/threonine-protein kinase n=1 Tax=Streptomyces sp. DT2A-34 TaxID=3051182 RepID=UPI00265BB1FF|nr:serine/threonine-protein kinase [Streptomyces sp. DT2A-34]MDO0915561.1 serine/threonine-protein kinase [Streptomyces sp. DT2A-34]